VHVDIFRDIPIHNERNRKTRKIPISHSPLLPELNNSLEEKPHSRENLLGLGIPCAALICSDFSTGCTGKNVVSTSLPAQEKRHRLAWIRQLKPATYPVFGGLTRFAGPANVPGPNLLRAGHDAHVIACLLARRASRNAKSKRGGVAARSVAARPAPAGHRGGAHPRRESRGAKR
jgi:hypothetical protein